MILAALHVVCVIWCLALLTVLAGCVLLAAVSPWLPPASDDVLRVLGTEPPPADAVTGHAREPLFDWAVAEREVRRG